MRDDQTDETDLTDGRNDGDWRSRYSKAAWAQIALELLYLVTLILLGIAFLLDSIAHTPPQMAKPGFVYSGIVRLHISDEYSRWIALAIAGLLGGTVFDLKWLYHSVAKGLWNCDRVLWRLIVPFNSSMVSLFTGFLFASGVIPFLRNESFEEIYTILGFGFVFGYFSDSILAALQNLARHIFGTLEDR